MSGNKKVYLGVDRCYIQDGMGNHEVWYGVNQITEKYGDPEQTVTYYEGKRIRTSSILINFDLSVTGYTYPELALNNTVDITFRNGTSSDDSEIHVIYNVVGKLDAREFRTNSDENDPSSFTIDFSSYPSIDKTMGSVPASHYILRTSEMSDSLLSELEGVLYGTETNDPRIPTVSDLVNMVESDSDLRITDHGDGTWSAKTDIPHLIEMVGPTEFKINWGHVRYIEPDTYRIRSGYEEK